MNWAWYRYCVCGHEKNMHRNPKECTAVFSFSVKFPMGTIKYPYGTRFCACYGFKLDNLKYLEQLYEKKVQHG